MVVGGRGRVVPSPGSRVAAGDRLWAGAAVFVAPSQRHPPGLQCMVSTGRHHGFESVDEQRLLLAVDFVGNVVEVFSQPFRLRFATAAGWAGAPRITPVVTTC